MRDFRPCLVFLSCVLFSWGPVTLVRANEAASDETAQLPIVGGQEESGYPAVGALAALEPGLGYVGAFCTGTLIAPQWVLTAAHCVSPMPSDGFFPEPLLTAFVIGPDARATAKGAGPADGVPHIIDRLLPHPKYDPNTTENDIALVHLAEPITDIEPMTIPSELLTAKQVVNKDILYVGYGVTDGVQQTGSGVKRSVHVRLSSYTGPSYLSMDYGVGVCFGDSGGPGIWTDPNGSEIVIGVNSTVFGMQGDPCSGNSFHTRVDFFKSWILNNINSPPKSCKDQNLCFCDEACLGNGKCDNGRCFVNNCYLTFQCFEACADGDDKCRKDCHYHASETALQNYLQVIWCGKSLCIGKDGPDLELCLINKCTEESSTCIPAGNGVADCRTVLACASSCGDEACETECLNSGSRDARELYFDLRQCSLNECQTDPTYGPQMTCTWEKCAAAMEMCNPAAECSLVGGGCPSGQACGLTPMGRYDCFPSLEMSEGQECQGDQSSLPCADGLVCVADSEDSGVSECVAVCTTDKDCLGGSTCDKTQSASLAGLGRCVCLDADEDGVCSLDDCDDTDASVPAGSEVCDGKDNNCDGNTDEGCSNPDPDDPQSSENGGCSSSVDGRASVTSLAAFAVLAVLLLRMRRRLSRNEPPVMGL